MTVKVLIPYNFTANDEKSLDFVAGKYAGSKDVFLTLFHAYHPVPELSVRNNPIMDKAERAASYLRQLMNERENELKQAKSRLVAKGFHSENIECIFTALKEDVGSDIIQLIQSGKFDEVVFNRNPGNIVNYFSRSISKRVTNFFTTGVSVHVTN